VIALRFDHGRGGGGLQTFERSLVSISLLGLHISAAWVWCDAGHVQTYKHFDASVRDKVDAFLN
jgi:hypothetical protein